MKSLRRLFVICCVFGLWLQTEAAQDHLNDSLSPLLMPAGEKLGETRGVWIPNTYGGVTGVVLDLTQVGTERMLRVRFGTSKELKPLLGKHYVILSDKRTEDKKRGQVERTVILVDEETRKEAGVKRILCYKITLSEDRFTDEGVKLTSEGSNYSLTMSEIADGYEVLYLIRFGTVFPNAEFPNLTKPPKSE